ncbi:MAG TPA: GNAT family N-acetyltransferase [Candidatus Izemoplasmatales bacterium]|nr:GNAT family N-acetyltransferase [Candidatus Izemoplasmatales bacterium]
MEKYVFKTLEIYHIPEIASLLYNRQLEEINDYPGLENDDFSMQNIQSSLIVLFTKNMVVGMGVYNQDVMVGYLFATIENSKRHGSMAWVPYQGMAIEGKQTKDLIRILYANASILWVEKGCFYHSVYIPLGNKRYKDAFLNLAFHIEQVNAVLDINKYDDMNGSSAIIVREANENDCFLLGEMSTIITDYQTQSPVYLKMTPAMLKQRKKAFRNLVQEDDVIVLIAEENNVARGYFDFEYLSNGLMIPNRSIELTVGGVLSHYRGKGVGKTLMNQGVRLLKKKGFQYVMTDWKAANIAASNFWPQCGFKPLAFRMVRVIQK